MSRVQFVPDYQVVRKQEACIRLLTSGMSDPRKQVLLDRAPKGIDWTAERTAASNDVDIVSYDLNRVVVRKEGPSGGFVRLSDAYYPGWRATVDGREAEVFKADVCFRAAAVGPGDHEIVFEYRPTYLPLAGVITGTCGCGLVAVGIFAWRGRRRGSAQILC